MTLDPDRRDAIRALAVEHADPSPARPRALRGRLGFAAAGLAVAALAAGAVLIVTTSLPVAPEAAPAPVPSQSASSMGPQGEALSGDSAASGTSSSAATESALGLLGSWTLTDAPSADSETVRIDAQTITVQRDCGQIFWQFAAAGGLLAVSGAGGDQACFLTDDLQPLNPDTSWGETLRGYRAVEGGWELLDGAGTVAGRLSAPTEGTASSIPSDETPGSRLDDPAPLGPGWSPASHEDLLGTWAVEGGSGDDRATVTFRDDDYLVDDCHSANHPEPPAGKGVAWTGDGTLFLAPLLPSDSGLCSPSLAFDPASIRSIAIADGILVAFDAAGVELARLERVGS
ncbi:hypothetical protein [Herbiconiux sp.]|uniref:hypothetical protein n=1 Tax=Herbiconiux sp. TaxID=1871186 RepID=UPI0025B9C86A|nr:hypothetical protein [Herbiconiux sp.]